MRGHDAWLGDKTEHAAHYRWCGGARCLIASGKSCNACGFGRLAEFTLL